MASDAELILTVLYPKVAELRFDMAYYLKHHIPMAEKGWGAYGMKSCVVSEVDAGSDFAVMVVTSWASRAEWLAAQKASCTKEIRDDFKNFTNVTPVMIVGKRIDQGMITNMEESSV